MKPLVFIFVISFISNKPVLSQFKWPELNFQTVQIPSTASTLSIENSTLKTVQQFFNVSAPNAFASNPIAGLIENFKGFINASNFQSAFQSAARQLSSNIDFDSAPKFIRQNLQKALTQFETNMNVTLSRGDLRVQNSLHQLNETFWFILSMIEQNATSTIHDLENNLSQFNKTIQNCIRDNGSHFQEIISGARDEAENCVRNRFKDGSAIIDEGRANIINAIHGAQTLNATIQRCSSLDTQEHFNFGCYTSAILSVRRDTIFLPLQMAKRFSEIDGYISSTRSDLIKCSSSAFKTIAEVSLNVTATIVDCLRSQQ